MTVGATKYEFVSEFMGRKMEGKRREGDRMEEKKDGGEEKGREGRGIEWKKKEGKEKIVPRFRSRPSQAYYRCHRREEKGREVDRMEEKGRAEKHLPRFRRGPSQAYYRWEERWRVEKGRKWKGREKFYLVFVVDHRRRTVEGKGSG